MPPSYSPNAPHRWRLDAWFHGRDEALTQVNFITARQKSAGEFTPRDTIVLHLYGRYCNASKFAGEVDLFEALDAVWRNYAIDENRLLVRGFSMGGASVWHWPRTTRACGPPRRPARASPNRRSILKIKTTGDGAPPWWEQTLWHYYDAVDYAANLFNLPTIEYHGEIDPQQQAGDLMARAMAEEGMRLVRVVGPQTAHKFHPDSKIELERMLDEIAARGRDATPRKSASSLTRLRTTSPLGDRGRPRQALGPRPRGCRSDGRFHRERGHRQRCGIYPRHGTGRLPARSGAARGGRHRRAEGDRPGPGSDRSWSAHFRKSGALWAVVETAAGTGLQKRHGLQGPIDDAFLDSFIFVSPTGTPLAPKVAGWAASEENGPSPNGAGSFAAMPKCATIKISPTET